MLLSKREEKKRRRWRTTRSKGRHDRWSREGKARQVTFAFMGPVHQEGKFFRYVTSCTASVYFNEEGNGSVTVEAPLGMERVFIAVHNPQPDQHLFVKSLRAQGLEMLMADANGVPVEVFRDGISLGGPVLKTGDKIEVTLRCVREAGKIGKTGKK